MNFRGSVSRDSINHYTESKVRCTGLFKGIFFTDHAANKNFAFCVCKTQKAQKCDTFKAWNSVV